MFLLNYPEGNQVTCLNFGQTESLYSKEHDSWVHCMAISPDSRAKATGDSNGQVCLSDGTADRELLHSLPGTQGQPVAFFPASETEFFCRDRPIDLTFLIGTDNTVTSIVVYQNGEAQETKRLASH